MGRDGQPKHRQAARRLQRRTAVRQPYERLLIVCEGEKTEPQYLGEIQQHYRLSTAHVQVIPGQMGTEPQRLLTYASTLFSKGDRERALAPRAFDRLVVVFDRDEHTTYHAALEQAAARSGKLRNDDRVPVPVEVVASVPCFELWLLLHFEDVLAPLHRRDAVRRLEAHIPRYEKGGRGLWAATKDRFTDADRRARHLEGNTTAHDGGQPFTAMHRLVSRLMNLKDDPSRGTEAESTADPG